MKKFIIGTMLTVSIFASQVYGNEINVDGQKIDTNVEINNGKAMVSARDLLEAMNYVVNWNNDTKSVDAQNKTGITLNNNGDLSEANPIYGLGDYFKSDKFTGDVYLNSIANEGGVSIANVTFEKGCINDWHTHDHVQILMGIMGEGYAQLEGQQAKKIGIGDVVVIPAGTKHWHGATHNSQFTHIAISGPAIDGMGDYGTKWLEPVNKTDYDNLQ